jgi:RNA-directed DNA polymerase
VFFTIPKSDGDKRKIAAPLGDLKKIQKWILAEVLSKLAVSRHAKAYIGGRSIKDNARYHCRKKSVLTLDIKDYFGRIRDHKIYNLFRGPGYSDKMSRVLTDLCCLGGRLPQGAPTSPVLSNLTAINIDKRLAQFAKNYRLKYTRYADDLIFSGNLQHTLIIKYAANVLEEQGFKINASKIRLMRDHQKQIVTGIVVNDKRQVSKELRRSIRQQIYYIEK